MKKIGMIWCIGCIIGLISMYANAQPIVKVGGYEFPPFVDEAAGSTSLTRDLIIRSNLSRHHPAVVSKISTTKNTI